VISSLNFYISIQYCAVAFSSSLLHDLLHYLLAKPGAVRLLIHDPFTLLVTDFRYGTFGIFWFDFDELLDDRRHS
jgi:hypothetical protein